MKAVMLMFDSLNRAMLSPYGCDWTETPNFQRLAQRCVKFNKCYAGSLPCMPARRELQTGRYNFLHRSWGPIEPFDDSMPQILKNCGVYTHLISDHVHYWEDGGATYHHRYNSWEIVRGQEGDKWKCLPELLEPDNSLIQNKDGEYFYATGDLQRHDAVNRKFESTEDKMALVQTVNHGLEFIDANHQCDKWFLQIECFDPHEPFYVPDKYLEFYNDDYQGKPYDWPPYHYVTEDETTAKHLKNKYAALLTMCDTYLGKILDKFDELDLWKDTMLIVNTDHGYLLGEHGWWSKVVMPCYDEIVHTPLFIYDPRFECGGKEKDQIVQTIDIPATLLEFFNVPRPADMQGKPIRNIIEKDEAIRDYALFGIHGAHVGIFDGRYVYMKAPATEENKPLFEYTMMPMHMRNLFSVGEMKKAEATEPGLFSFTKGCPVWKIPKGNGNGEKDFSSLLIEGKDSEDAKHIDNNSLVTATNFGDKLFDMLNDPGQNEELQDPVILVRMANLLQRAMIENDSPLEQFERIGICRDHKIRYEDIKSLKESNLAIPEELQDYHWTKGAVNTYKALMKFIPKEQKEKTVQTLLQSIPQYLIDNEVVSESVINAVPSVVDAEYADMVQYFIGLSGRTS